MDVHKILKPGQQINLECKTMNKSWNSSIFDFENGNVLVASPMEEMNYVFIKPDTPLIIVAASEAGMYRIPAKAIENRKGPFVLVIQPSDEISAIQRRQFFRLKNPDINLKYIIINTSDDYYSKNLKDANVIDLSGSGIAIELPKEEMVKPETKIKLQIHISDIDTTINAVGKAIRCMEQECGTLKICLHYIVIEEKDRDKIIGYLFKEQAKRGRQRI